MSLQILGGQAAGHTIFLPGRAKFRPTAVLLRRKLFDAHQTWMHESFFDVCAGSGAMGMEAYSRGAQSFWGEQDTATLKLLAKNLQSLQDKIKKIPTDEEDGRETGINEPVIFNTRQAADFGISKIRPKFPLTIFFDPPYEQLATLLRPFLTAVQQQKIVWQEIWIESDRQKGLKDGEILAVAAEIFGTSIARTKIVTCGTNFVVKLRANNNNASSL
jgi:16S rRNA (guanine966-N2)-methyltransferase